MFGYQAVLLTLLVLCVNVSFNLYDYTPSLSYNGEHWPNKTTTSLIAWILMVVHKHQSHI